MGPLPGCPLNYIYAGDTMKRNTTDEELLELCNKYLIYNKENGAFTNKISGKGRIKGKEIKTITKDGYTRITINGVQYRGHRIAFLMSNGYLPEFLDHKNNIRHDNRLENLRECTRSENNQNKLKRRSSRAQYIGVEKLPGGTYRTKCKSIHVGCYPTAIEAAKAYNERAIELYGEFAFLNKIN